MLEQALASDEPEAFVSAGKPPQRTQPIAVVEKLKVTAAPDTGDVISLPWPKAGETPQLVLVGFAQLEFLP